MDERGYLSLSSLINSALYVTLVFVAALATHNRLCLVLAIGTAGVCYLCASAQLWKAPSWVNLTLLWLSIGLGAAAGLACLIGAFR